MKSKWLAVIIIAGIGWFGLSLIRVGVQKGMVIKEVRGLEAKIQNLEKDNSNLKKFVEYVKNPWFVEKEARLKLNFKAPGEEVVFVYPDSGFPNPSPDDFQKRLARIPNWMKWTYYVLGY